MLSNSALARTTLNTLPPNTSGHSASASTAAMNGSVASTDRLKLRSRPASRLAAMKSSMSGWSQRMVAIMAPRRAPADMMVRHIASHTSMKDSGPGGIRPHAAHRRALGPQGRKIVADAAALLHRQRRFAQVAEDAAQIVLDVAHDEAIEQGHPPVRPGAGHDPARRQELEPFQGAVERLLPLGRVRARARPAPARPGAKYPRSSGRPACRPVPSAGIWHPRSAAKSARSRPWH